jgi:pyruvate/2-oxoacid:ferredoxin oxidoreductase alpha subunit
MDHPTTPPDTVSHYHEIHHDPDYFVVSVDEITPENLAKLEAAFAKMGTDQKRKYIDTVTVTVGTVRREIIRDVQILVPRMLETETGLKCELRSIEPLD